VSRYVKKWTIKLLVGMQIKLIADNYKELAFTDQLPDVLTNYLIP